MSEKVTFQELIESIAEETDNTEQFTHDFLKDFAEVINGGLQQNDTVNIAGFGKFKLRKMEEREGYNPQTEEKITIPPHNKVVFKPYKDLRELVNAPYAHLEPELIKEEDSSVKEEEDTSSPTTSETDEGPAENIESDQDTTTEEENEITPQVTAEESAPQDTASADDTTTDQSDDTEKSKVSNEKTEQEQDPFDFDNDDAEAPNSLLQEIADEDDNEDHESTEDLTDDSSVDDDDIVEFQESPAQEESKDEKEDENVEEFDEDDEKDDAPAWLDAMVGPEASGKIQHSDEEDDQKSKKQGQEPQHTDSKEDKESDETYMPGNESSEDKKEGEQIEEKPKTANPNMDRNMRNRNSGSSLGIWIAAAVILLMLAGGVLYFSLMSDTNQRRSNTQKVASTSTVQKNDASQRQEQSADQQKETRSENKQQSTSQKQPQKSAQQPTAEKSSGNKSSADKTATKNKKVSHSIKKGQTLWSIAEDKYGNPRLWPWIYGKNDTLTNPHVIQTGRLLTVPLPSGNQNRLSQSDSVGVAKGFLSTYQWYRNNEPSKAKNHLWVAMQYHENIRDLATTKIDQADLSYANRFR
ncbi:nucleoid DNA-binding protein [Fodinibius salinus]|uniref:Nucleoid DNA-binding protein n=1 Tax=Fodinibius salinus TaxID=860790 RepID=A0A5D3YMX5_9BACT|nr:HU family DNA-binding protein [Fodinibius salinus]TYP95535.1 nucleoid DNA-binding protein [Fodinibius salinus]